MDILKRRYANGDISKEEFEEKMKTLDVFDNK
ncbi:MAG: SHOCT domain-containing protein [Gillisia sp.]|nr:SHOCT domain-containing protein [Gillisia sp.]